MMSRRRWRTAARAVALLYLVLASGPAAASVLCVGSDGHLAIESALADECCPHDEGAGAEIASPDDCANCTDTPLALEGTLQKKSERIDALPSLVAVAMPPSFDGAVARAGVDRSGSRPIASDTVVLGRTIRLLL